MRSSSSALGYDMIRAGATASCRTSATANARFVVKGLRADRERALLCVAYETRARRGELVVLQIADIEFWPNGTGQASIRRGETNAEGQGRLGHLSRETVKWLKTWLVHAKISEGPVFRRLIGQA